MCDRVYFKDYFSADTYESMFYPYYDWLLGFIRQVLDTAFVISSNFCERSDDPLRPVLLYWLWGLCLVPGFWRMLVVQIGLYLCGLYGFSCTEFISFSVCVFC